MTGPSSGDQNQYYRQQEERAERAREQARSLRGDDPEEPTEVAGSTHSPDPDRTPDARQSSDPAQSPDAQSSDGRSSDGRSAEPGSRASADSGEAESTEEDRGS